MLGQPKDEAIPLMHDSQTMAASMRIYLGSSQLDFASISTDVILGVLSINWRTSHFPPLQVAANPSTVSESGDESVYGV